MTEKVNLNKLLEEKPGNESEEHYLCKIAGFFYLYQQGCRIIGTELSGFMSQRDYDRWQERQTIEITGKRKDKLENEKCPFCDNKLIQEEWSRKNQYECIANNFPQKKRYGKKNSYYEKYKKMTVKEYDSLTMDDDYCNKSYWKEDGKWFRRRESNSRNQIIDCAGIEKAKYASTENAKIRGIEAKASYGDFKSGFCTGADITYIITPKGTIPKKEIPKYIGLIEVDLDNLRIIVKPEVYVKGLDIKKRATTNKSDSFYGTSSREERIRAFIEKVARRNTMNKIFGEYYPKMGG